MATYYEILGVKKTAKAPELKRAYRKRARKAHPDKGGTDAEMAEVNQAYDCLIDPVRRLTYDETGSDAPINNPIELDVRALLFEAFDSLLANDVMRDYLRHVKKFIRDRLQQLDQDQHKTKDAIAELKRRRAKIRRKSGENLFHSLVDQRLQQGAGVLQVIEHRKAVHEAALKTLKEYEEDEEALKIMIAKWPASSASTSAWATFS